MTLTAALWLPLAAAVPALAAEPPPSLQARLEAPEETLAVGGRMVEAGPLREFYRLRGWRMAWSGPGREAIGDRLLMDMQDAAVEEGLSPERYAVPPTGSDSERDLLVTDTLLRFAHDLTAGSVGPWRSVGGLGPDTRPPFDAARFLRRVTPGVPLAALLLNLAPRDPGYVALRRALARYRTIVHSGGWAEIPEGRGVKPGRSDPRLPLVRRHLIQTGDLAAGNEAGDKLDPVLSAALRHYQERLGLEADGALGRQTLAALNVPAEARVAQIVTNLERRRAMPRQLEPTRIDVNIPDQTLELIENSTPVLAMRVVVGDIQHQTPGLDTAITAVVLNPSWTIPPSIASKEILPKLLRDPNYLAANNMHILDGGPDGSGAGVNWDHYRGRAFPWRLRQKPGPDNALGRLKFHLAESDDIYLHDTPHRTAFGRPFRALSHGCVRVEKPVELAERILGGEWTGKVAGALADRTTRTVPLDVPLPVYLLYWTAWADGDGTVHFRDDLYGHDARLRAAVKRLLTSQVAQSATKSPL